MNEIQGVGGFDRRQFLQRLAVGGAVAWVATPVILTVDASRASATPAPPQVPPAPTVDELKANATVQAELDAAWLAVQSPRGGGHPEALNGPHEEGGWIYKCPDGSIHVKRAPPGARDFIDLSNPPCIDAAGNPCTGTACCFVVGTYHVHEWDGVDVFLGPSGDDADMDNLDGVPGIVVITDPNLVCSAQDTFNNPNSDGSPRGPSSRRGGLTGNCGYPAATGGAAAPAALSADAKAQQAARNIDTHSPCYKACMERRATQQHEADVAFFASTQQAGDDQARLLEAAQLYRTRLADLNKEFRTSTRKCH